MARRRIPPTLLAVLSLLFTITSLLPHTTTAQSLPSNTTSTNGTDASLPLSNTNTTSPSNSTLPRPALKIADSSGTIYSYAGCWNESAGLPGTTGLRSLDGINEGLPGVMTVARCLEFCAWGDREHGAYRLAGLEYARECWCGDELNPFSVPLADDRCDFGCDGANTTACGGSLKLTVYNATHGVPDRKGRNGAAEWRRRGARGAVVAGTTTMGLVVWGLVLGAL
ncbi:WSC domain-containing protein [Nemania sp. NC0429]|nr:WSC domain-containing protein [Nemania sp. NC0429]